MTAVSATRSLFSMEYTRDQILAFIREKAAHPMKMKELGKALSIRSHDYAEFRNVVKSLLDSGELVKLKRNRIGLAQELNVVVGKISMTRSGAGFVTRDDAEGADDVMIPSGALGTALDGDRVMIRYTGKTADRQLGAVVKVIERTGRNIVGVFHLGRHFAHVTPDNPKVHRDIYIPIADSQGAVSYTHLRAHET